MKTKLFIKRAFLFFLFMIPLGLLAQTAKGRIIDTKGNAIPFATIVEKGTSNGTTADDNGNFNLKVSKLPTTLDISSLGYVSKSVTTTTGEETITLQEENVGLDEVVLSGLASNVKRANLANTVATVSSKDLVGATPPQTLDGALAGKFTGAVVSSNSGAPGGGLSIKLRGVTSINSNSQPLYIIDGIYLDNSSIAGGLNVVSAAAAGGSASNQDNPSNRIADINPDDIENIEILKGASAAAIYGSRAAAGVIIITTKKGKAGDTKVDVSQSFGFNEVINLQGTRPFTEASVLQFFGAGNVALFNAAKASGQLHDYEKELYGEKGFITNTNVGISGGNEKTTFYTGFTHNDEDGIVKNTGFVKSSARINIDHKINDFIKVSITSNYITSKADRGFFNNDNTGTTIGVSLVGTPPWAQLFPDANGVYPNNPFGASNPLQTRDLVTNNETVNRFITGGSADISIYRNDHSDLKAIVKTGLDYYTLATRAIFPKDLQFESVDGGDNGVSVQGTTENKNTSYSAFLVHNYRTENNVNYRTQAGLTKETFSRNSILSTAKDLIGSETNLDQAGSLQVEQTRLDQKDAGFFAQEEVNFKDQFIATLGIRGDKSTNNGDANEVFYYPKTSLALNLHNFDFWKFDKISQFKVRAAYGESGNFAPNGALYTSFGSTTIGGAGLGITLNGVLGDLNIKPEQQKEFETGFDLGLMSNKVNLSFTWYKKQVDDLILNASTEPSSGFTSKFVNAGKLQNTGVEIGLNIEAFDTKDFKWNSSVNFWTNDSKITRLDIPAFNLGAFGATLGTFRIEQGKSATQIVGISETGLKVHGDAEADFQMSFNNNLVYKDFELSFLWHWKQGGDNVNLSTLLFDLNGTTHDFDAKGLDPSGTLTNGPYRTSRLGVSADVFVQDASYLRLREVGLSYNIPKVKLERWFGKSISGAKLGFSGHNLINIFKYNSYDPEVSNFGSNGISTGVEVLPFPSSKRFMFHLTANF